MERSGTRGDLIHKLSQRLSRKVQLTGNYKSREGEVLFQHVLSTGSVLSGFEGCDQLFIIRLMPAFSLPDPYESD